MQKILLLHAEALFHVPSCLLGLLIKFVVVGAAWTVASDLLRRLMMAF